MVGRRREHRQWTEMALERIDDATDPLAVSKLLLQIILRAQHERAVLNVIDRAVRLCEEAGDRLALATLHTVLIWVLAAHRRFAEAERSAGAALELLTGGRLEASALYVAMISNRALMRSQQGRFEEARADVADAEARAIARGDREFVASSGYNLRSAIEYAAGNKLLALDYEKRMYASEYGTKPSGAIRTLPCLAVVPLLHGDVDGAMAPLRELLLLVTGNESYSYNELEIAALALALRGNVVAAARIMGCVRALAGPEEPLRLPARQDAHDRLREILERELSSDAIAKAEAGGAVLTADDAIAEALAGLGLDQTV
jgi:hypothetical protein